MSILLKQHLNTHKQQLRTLGLQIIIHHTHAPVHKHMPTTVICLHRCTHAQEHWPEDKEMRAKILADFDPNHTRDKVGDRRQELVFIGQDLKVSSIETPTESNQVHVDCLEKFDAARGSDKTT
jgi:hypothetical protein